MSGTLTTAATRVRRAVRRRAARSTTTSTALRARMALLIATLDDGPLPAAHRNLEQQLLDRLRPLDAGRAWLTLAVLAGRLPEPADVRTVLRVGALDGAAAALARAVRIAADSGALTADHPPTVTVLTDRVLVDVHHTAQTDFATGIQRVTREASRRWAAWHEPTMVGWTADMSAIRELTSDEANRAFHGGKQAIRAEQDAVVVPWRCTYLLPELAAEVTRTARLQAMAEFSSTTLNVIGYDLVPISTSETSHVGLIPGFARNLAALRHARTVVPISVAAAEEYEGWRAMLGGVGMVGPAVLPVALPNQVPIADPDQVADATARLTLADLPMVLVVGSHEPRKNHVAVLHAAELLWREGLRFSLTFIGGNSWNSDVFTAALTGLVESGRPVETISAASDALLFGGYRCARFTVFPSLNEGFGLPVVESLSCGTPVVTSKFGSMAEIAGAGGGALLIDPRDDHDLAAAMRSLLTDDDLLARLRRDALDRPGRSWDEYAEQTWAALTSGPGPGGPSPAAKATTTIRPTPTERSEYA